MVKGIVFEENIQHKGTKMETLEIVPVAEKIALDVFQVTHANDAEIHQDAGSITMYLPVLIDNDLERSVKVRIDAGDEETFIRIGARGKAIPEYETRVFTDTLTPELLERYLRHGRSEVVYELEFELKVAYRSL
jgi:hypothetical protein